MKRWVRLAVNLYPAAWRRRYAAEFDALLNEVNAGWADLFDILRGAFSMRFISMHFTAWKFRTMMVAFTLIGTAIGAAVAFGTHSQYGPSLPFAANPRTLVVVDHDSAKKNAYSQLRFTMPNVVFLGEGRNTKIARVAYLPSRPERPVSPRRMLWIFGGLGAGLLAGLLAAYGSHWRILVLRGGPA